MFGVKYSLQAKELFSQTSNRYLLFLILWTISFHSAMSHEGSTDKKMPVMVSHVDLTVEKPVRSSLINTIKFPRQMNMIQRYWTRNMVLRKKCKHIWILPLLVKQPMFLYRHLIAKHPRCPFWLHRTSQGLEEVSKNVTLCKWLILSRKNSGISGFPADRWWEFDLT